MAAFNAEEAAQDVLGRVMFLDSTPGWAAEVATGLRAAYAAGLERAAVIAESTMEETMLSAPDEHGVCQEQHVRLPGNALIAAAIRQEGRDGA